MLNNDQLITDNNRYMYIYLYIYMQIGEKW